MPGNYIQIGGQKKAVTWNESKVTRDEQGRFARKGSGGGTIPGTSLLTKQERLRRNPNSLLRGAAIPAIPSESRESQTKRARQAAREFRAIMGR